MDHFHYRDGRLCAEAVPLARVAEDLGTPFYCYSTATIERHYNAFADAFADLPATVCYAMKANSNIAVVATLARLGAGADVVSGGEIKRALAAGVPAGRIVFSGIGKTAEEMAAALKAGILQINVESDQELEALGEVGLSLGVAAPVAVCINPDVDANTHEKVTTGKVENKFGIDWTRAHEVFTRAAAMPSIAVKGIAVHIGSQVTDLEPFREAFVRMRDVVAMLVADGLDIETIDVGGGLAISYGEDGSVPTTEAYAEVVGSTLGGLARRLILEPGRVIVGNAGVLVTRVLYVKEGASRTFAIVDAAMNDLLRPAFYNAYHDIVPVNEPEKGAPTAEMDVVGPICETGDTFAVRRPMPALKPGDLLAIRTAGAYCSVMSSAYNARPLVPEVLVRDDVHAVVRQRVSVDDMLARESFPGWFNAKDPAVVGEAP